MRGVAMTVADLIALLQQADQDALVIDEYEGSIAPICRDDVRIGEADLIRLIEADDTRLEPYDGWFTSGHHDGDNRLIRTSKVVLMCAGQSARQYPTRLDGGPTDEDGRSIGAKGDPQ
jgi:hypothetical protein